MFSFGFYNSKDGDRKYNASHFGKMFDGVIQDGVFGAAPTPLNTMFNVTPNTPEPDLTAVINPGKAWLMHTWNVLDAKASMIFNQCQANYKRTDVIVLEINNDYTDLTGSDPRTNSIKIVEGSNVLMSADDAIPPLTQVWNTNQSERRIWQYPIAYITIYGSNYTSGTVEYVANTIKSDNIKMRINPDGAVNTDKYVTWIPLVTGATMETDISEYLPVSDWETSFNQMLSDNEAQFNQWFDDLHDTVVIDPSAQAALTQLNLKVDNKILYGSQLPPSTLDPGQVYFQVE